MLAGIKCRMEGSEQWPAPPLAWNRRAAPEPTALWAADYLFIGLPHLGQVEQ